MSKLEASGEGVPVTLQIQWGKCSIHACMNVQICCTHPIRVVNTDRSRLTDHDRWRACNICPCMFHSSYSWVQLHQWGACMDIIIWFVHYTHCKIHACTPRIFKHNWNQLQSTLPSISVCWAKGWKKRLTGQEVRWMHVWIHEYGCSECAISLHFHSPATLSNMTACSWNISS